MNSKKRSRLRRKEKRMNIEIKLAERCGDFLLARDTKISEKLQRTAVILPS